MRLRAALPLALLLACLPAAAQDSPRIPSLNPLADTAYSDPMRPTGAERERRAEYTAAKRAYDQAVEEANRAMFRGEDMARYAAFYRYRGTEGDTVMQVAARCAIRYDTLVTANGLEDASAALEGVELLLPVVNGLYIPRDPKTPIEILLAKEYSAALLSGGYPSLSVGGRDCYLIPDGRLSPTERAFFLEPGLVLPLKKSVLTSEFGMRVSPISGKWLMHKGIDMAAPSGTSIYACKGGTVASAVDMDRVYGNYVIIDHGKGMTSLYAHMSRRLAEKGARVLAGQEIGKVGMTGMATGPHLHFEIRLNGELQDPQKYLPGF